MLIPHDTSRQVFRYGSGVLSCCEACSHPRRFPTPRHLFPVDIMRFKICSPVLLSKRRSRPLSTLCLYSFSASIFAVTKIGLFTVPSILPCCMGVSFRGNAVLVILRECAVTLAFGHIYPFTQHPITIAAIITVYHAIGKFNTLLVKSSYNAIFSRNGCFTAFL